MADQPAEKPCCRRTREQWMRRIQAFAPYPVIKDVPCNESLEIIELFVHEPPAA
jgi:hypothetical protein